MGGLLSFSDTTVAVMTENVRKLVGVAAIAALVVVGVVTTSGGDDVDFTRNAAFTNLPEAQRARLIPAFAPQPASKGFDIGPIGKTNNELHPIFRPPKASIFSTGGANGLSAGKASVLEGTGLFGKGGKSSIRLGGGMNGKTGNYDNTDIRLSRGRKAGIWLQSGGTEGVADRILECASGGNEEMKERAGASSVVLLVVLAFNPPAVAETCDGSSIFIDQAANDSSLKVFPKVEMREAKLLATCMESKVGDVFLKSHTEAMAADCVAIVLPELSPDRAKQLGIYWQTQQQLICVPPGCNE